MEDNRLFLIVITTSSLFCLSLTDLFIDKYVTKKLINSQKNLNDKMEENQNFDLNTKSAYLIGFI